MAFPIPQRQYKVLNCYKLAKVYPFGVKSTNDLPDCLLNTLDEQVDFFLVILIEVLQHKFLGGKLKWFFDKDVDRSMSINLIELVNARLNTLALQFFIDRDLLINLLNMINRDLLNRNQ